MNVGLIPVRGGSKSIPFKNIKKINGYPLVYWTVKAAVESKNIERLYVSTDSDNIKNIVENFGFQNVEVIYRSAENSTDEASTESVMLEFATKYNFENIILIQATSPLLTSVEIDGGFDLFKQDDTDSVISVVNQKRFIWEINNEGLCKSINYDIFKRPRRQEFAGYLVENGAFYITSKQSLLSSSNRISGKIRPYIMHENTFFEIDEKSDWVIIEQLMKIKKSKIKKSKDIKLLVSDCDGVLTDSGMYYSENGDELKKFNTRDGVALKLFKEKGIILCIITGEKSELVQRRANKIGIDRLYMGVSDKLLVLNDLVEELGINLSQVAYIGDDINDYDCLEKCGFSACPNDAVSKVKEVVNFVCSLKGGEGVIREIYDTLNV